MPVNLPFELLNDTPTGKVVGFMLKVIVPKPPLALIGSTFILSTDLVNVLDGIKDVVTKGGGATIDKVNCTEAVAFKLSVTVIVNVSKENTEDGVPLKIADVVLKVKPEGNALSKLYVKIVEPPAAVAIANGATATPFNNSMLESLIEIVNGGVLTVSIKF